MEAEGTNGESVEKEAARLIERVGQHVLDLMIELASAHQLRSPIRPAAYHGGDVKAGTMGHTTALEQQVVTAASPVSLKTAPEPI